MLKHKVNFKRFKNVFGASIMEIIFVLGIMAVLTPVVIKFAFKDLADVRYLNIAKQLKQLIKSLSAYASTERDSWVGDSGDIPVSKLDTYNLTDSIDSQIVDGLSLKYVKELKDNGNSSYVLYGIVDMSKFPLDVVSFNKTLFFVENNIGYVVKGESCGDCGESVCVCAINGNWGIGYSLIKNASTYDGKNIAVVRIDDNLLEDEYDSTLYLYRNRSDDNLNTMGWNLNMGTNSANANDVKDVNWVYAYKILGAGETLYLPSLKSKKGVIDSRTVNMGSMYVRKITESSQLSLDFSENINLYAPYLIFQKESFLGNFTTKDASLIIGDVSTKPSLNIVGITKLKNVNLQNLEFRDLKNGNRLFVKDVNEDDSKFRVETPNLKATKLNIDVLSVNNNYMYSNGNKIKLRDGVIYTNTRPVLNIDIKGESLGQNLYSIIDNFNKFTTGSDKCSIRKKLDRFETGSSSVDSGCGS